MEFGLFNEILFIKTRYVTGGENLVFYNCINDGRVNIYAEIYNRLSLYLYKDLCAIHFTQKETLSDTFRDGVCIRVNVMFGIFYKTGRDEIEEITTRVRPQLIKRLPEPFIDIFLNSLMVGITQESQYTESLIFQHSIDAKCDVIGVLEQRLLNLSDEKINTIVKNILNNELSYSTSSNVFNLHSTEPKQQTALKMKHLSTKIQEVNDYKIRQWDQAFEFENGYWYIVFPKKREIHYLYMEILYAKFIDLISKDYIYCFKIISKNMAHVVVNVGILDAIFQDFSKINIGRRIIQFKRLEDGGGAIEEYKASNEILLNHWQMGDSRLLKLNTFSEETLTSQSKRFEIYGVFCKHVLNVASRDHQCPIYINMKIEYRGRIFYYASIFCFIKNVSFLKKFLVECNKGACNHSIIGPGPINIWDLNWIQRPCSTIIHHTYFRWVNEALRCTKHDKTSVLDAAIKNLVHYKYIKETGSLNVYSRNQDEATTFAQLYIETSRNVYRDLDISATDGKIKFSPFDGLKDGPLVSAVSVRMCEKIRNEGTLDKTWKINILNLNMLFNLPNYSGYQSRNNTITL